MNSSTFKTEENNKIFQKDSSDSGISEDMKASPKNIQWFSQIKQVGTKNKLEKILELPAITRKRNYKKRNPEDGMPGGTGTFTYQEYLDKMSILQQLRKEEKQLKIAIAYEQLRKEQPIFLDTDILHEKIAECQKLLQEARSEYKMKNVMCVNLQMANTLQRIVGQTKAVHKRNGFSCIERNCIEDLLKKKKQLNRMIGAKRKEIAKIDEEILKLKKTSCVANNHIRNKPVAESGLDNENSETNNLEELKKLEKNNKEVTERVHLLSWIIQSLIPHTESRWQKEQELVDMMTECQKVSTCQFNDIDDMNALLASVCSVDL